LAILLGFNVHANTSLETIDEMWMGRPVYQYTCAYLLFQVLQSWKFHDLDFILTEGDSNFKQLGFQETPFVDQFPRIISVEGKECNTNFKAFGGEFSANGNTINFISEEIQTSGDCH